MDIVNSIRLTAYGKGREKILIVFVGLVVVGIGVCGWGQIVRSQIIGQNYRYSMVVASESGEVEYVSFDPEEKQIVVISWPSKLAISSRSVGSYQVGDLYQLGSYDGEPGEWVRQKVQGYMKIPIVGFVEVERLSGLGRSLGKIVWSGQKVSSISRLDGLILLGRSLNYDVKRVAISELVRAGVLSESGGKYEYQGGRLQQFLGKRIFDWGVGEEELAVAVINTSEITGLATDVASFLGNAGLSVVAVRSEEGEEGEEGVTRVMISSELEEKQRERVERMLESWFGWEEISISDTREYRAEIVVKLGEDAEELF